MTPDHKARILAWCLEFAKVDPEAAIHAAGWYEQNEPALLANLRRKVEQEVKREASRQGGPEPAGDRRGAAQGGR